MHNWLEYEIKKLMQKKGRSIKDIEINESPINENIAYGSIPIITIDFTDVESGIFVSCQVVIDTKKDSLEDILRDIKWEIESFLKREEIAL